MGLLQPDRRRDDRLVGAALGSERDPRWGTDQNRLAAGIDPERPRLERPVDEGVVDSPDRKQRLAVPRPGRAELAEQPDEVAFGDPELDVLAVLGLAPVNQCVRVVGEPVDPIAGAPDAGAVDPAAEVGRRRDVGADGDDVLGDLGRRARELDEEAAEPLLGRDRCRCGRCRSPPGRPAARGGATPSRSERLRGRPAEPGLGRALVELGPRVVGVGSELAGELAPLLGGEQRRVVGRMALGRQAPRLDRVGEDHARAGRAPHRPRGRRRAGRRGRDRRGRAPRAAARGPPRRRSGARSPSGRRPSPGRRSRSSSAAAAEQPLVLLVRHLIDPMAERLAAGPLEELSQAPAVLHRDRPPARGLEHRTDPPGGDVRHDPVERLAIEVDDPQHLAEPRDHRVHERLPDRTLVELGVTDKRDVAAPRGTSKCPAT